jgi:uncharacterized repeat protein (TIGR01451 family)
MNLASRILHIQQQGFLRSAAAWVFGLLFLMMAQFANAQLITTISNVASMGSLELPVVVAQVDVTATLTDFNNSTVTFDQDNIMMEQGVTSPLILTVTNAGINDLNNGSVVITFPEGVSATFPVDPLYSAIQQLDGTWLVTFTNPLLPTESINIAIELNLLPDADEGVAAITAEFTANTVLMGSDEATITIGTANAGLFLVHQVDKAVVEPDESLVYTLAVTNQLPVAANAIYLTNVLPAGVRFISGSVKINSLPVPDPVVSADGRTLIFDIGTLLANETATVTYVAYVTAMVKPGALTSTSIAQGSNAVSNKANVVTLVRQDAINVDSHVVGRVLVDSCSMDDTEAVGVTSMRLRSQLVNDHVLYTLNVKGTGVPVNNYQVLVNLPKALSYIDDSTTLDGELSKNPQVSDGQLTFLLGNQPEDWQHQLTFKVKPDREYYGIFETTAYASYEVEGQGTQKTQTLLNTYEASLSGKNYRTFTYWPRFKTLDAQLQAVDMENIDELKKVLEGEVVNHITVTGHTDSHIIHGAGKNKFANNKELSKSRAESIAVYLVDILGIEKDKITVIGKGEDEPVASNATEEGRQQNRRVEMLVEVLNSNDYRRSSIILGQESFVVGGVYNKTVLNPQKENDASVGLANVRLLMEDGRFVDTDKEGRYHFEGLKPGTHVIQLDPQSIPDGYEAYLCENNTRFAGTPTSHFVDIQKGLIWRSNFHVTRVKNSTAIETGLKLNSELQGDVLHYQMLVQGSALENGSISAIIDLPEAIILDEASVTMDGNPVTMVKDGKQWRIDLPSADADWKRQVNFNAQINMNNIGEYVSAASLRVESANGVIKNSRPVTNIVKLEQPTNKIERYDFGTHFTPASTALAQADKVTLEDIAFLFKGKVIEKIEIIGHTDNVLSADETNDTLKTNDNLSQLRAQEIGNYLAEKLQLADDRVIAVGMGDKKAVASNYTEEGRAQNRRVEIYVHTVQENAPVISALIKPESIKQRETLELVETPQAQALAEQQAVAPVTLPTGILSHKNGDVLPGSSASVRVNMDSRLSQQLYVDGREIPASRIGFSKADPVTNKTISTYFGVNMGEAGDHELRLKGVDPFGNVRFDQVVKYTRTGEIKNIRFVSAENNIADGKTPVLAKIDLFDDRGNKVNAAIDLVIMEGELQPYVETIENKLPLVDNSNKMVSVSSDGTAKFNPVSKAGFYRVKLQYNNVDTELKIYVKPEYRDWVMVGVADGTLGYENVSGNMQNLAANDIEEEYYDDGKLAFYAKGKVLGKYLLTVAFDSSKTREEDERLMQLINPDEYYTLYGDNTEQQFDAASKEKLYLRLDADNFYALFGDYNTDLNVTELTRYSRSFTGAKAVYESGNVSVNAFAAQSSQLFRRDEILGDGTSGLYRLSSNNVVVNSEKVTLQVRDRFHSERIISEQSLNRFGDYNLDYLDGSLYFKQPIMRHDENFNPVYIVVDYETHGNGKESLIVGGRAAAKLLGERIEIGVSHIDEGVEGVEGQLSGVDARFDITREMQFKAEYAISSKMQLGNEINADAFLAELKHRAETFEAGVYVQEQEAGFGLGQLNQSELGMRKYGALGNVIIAKDLEVTADIGHQDNTVDDGERNTLLSSLIYTPGDWEFTLGGTIAEDTDNTGKQYQSEILNTGVAHTMLDDRLRLYTRSDWQLNNDDASVDFPERHIVGSEFMLTEDIDIYSEYEYATSDIIKADSTRAGLRSRPWANATMHNGFQQDVSDAEARTFSVFGLTQAVPFADHWRASFTFDQTDTIDRKLYARVNEDTPLASGTSNTAISTNGLIDEDFWATTAGLGYLSGVYVFDTRIEYRETETQQKYGFFTGWQRNLVDGIGHALRLQTFITEDQLFNDQLDAELRYSAVIRPLGSDVFWFNRTELKHQDMGGLISSSKTDKLVEHLAINYLPTINWQIATHIGYKLTRTNLAGDTFTTDTYLLGNETRYDLTPRWDIGAHYHVITTPDMGLTQDSYGLSVGVDIAKNLWLSIGYNVDGYTDEDFDANGYTAKGPFMKLRFKFDQDTFSLND